MTVTVTLGEASFHLSASFPLLENGAHHGTLVNAESSDSPEQLGPRSISATI